MSECKKLDDEALKKTSGGMLVRGLTVITNYDIDKMYCADYCGSKTGNERACRYCTHVSITPAHVVCTHEHIPNIYNQKSM